MMASAIMGLQERLICILEPGKLAERLTYRLLVKKQLIIR